MTIRDIAVAFGFEVDKKSEQQAESSIKGISNMAKKLLGAIGVVFSVKGLSELAQAAADAEALKSQFTQVFGDMEEDATNSLQKIADETGVVVNRMKGSYTQIAAFSKTTGATPAESLDLANRAMVAIADSAAFYDRSLEDVTESLQSFLKGNFQQDAALGLSCTETTRNAAANKLYGKSFKDLSEQQKQLTLLQMVEDANELSGALNQAKRESDTWTNQMGNMKQAIQDFKAEAGSTFLKPAIKVLKVFTSLIQTATKAIKVYAGENGFLSREVERLKNLFKFMQPTVERVINSISKGMQKGKETIGKVVDKLGGLDNVLRIVTIAVGALAVAIAGPKLLGAIKTFGSIFSKALNPATLKILAIVAVIVILVLLVEDFINFMQGNDSLLGSILEKSGVDCDALREKISETWDGIKEKLSVVWEHLKEAGSKVWEAIKKAAESIFEGLKKFWEKWGDDIMATIGNVFGFLEDYFYGFLDVVQGVADFISAVFSGDWAAAWQAIKDIFAGVWDMIKSYFSIMWEWLKLAFEIGLDFIKGLWDSVWGGIKDFFVGIWEKIVETATNFIDKIKNKISDVVTTIKEGIGEAVDWIKSLPEKAITWGKDMIQGLIDGIKSMIGKVGESVKGVAEKITSFLHFSVPDEGPLTKYESWMPDFMGGLAKGISSNEDLVLDKVKGLAGGIQTLMSAATANAGTASASNVTNKTSSVVQNVEFYNSFTGGSAETQRNVSRVMKKSAVDATTQMARGLAYARG